MRRFRFGFAFALALVMAVSLAPASARQADAARSSSNFELGKRIPNIGGTDLELFSRELTMYKESATGDFITVETPVERHFALVGGTGGGKGGRLVDVTDPEGPFIASEIPACAIGQGDVQIRADGMLAAIAKQGSGTCKTVGGKSLTNGSALVDISNVYDPQVVGLVEQSGGSHNHTLHPNGKHLYVSPSLEMPGGPGNSAIPIWDISDPTAPKFVKTFTTPGNGPHDVRFSPDGKRAYVASVSTYYILNTENPENPTVISTFIPPGGYIGHDTLVTPDKAFLIVGDEAGGGAPYPCPGGAIYIYDIRNESAPILLGAAEAGGGPVTARAIDEVPPAGIGVGGCTSHVMDLNPDQKSLSIGWYSLGTRTFSFASLYNADGTPKAGPQLAAAWGKNGVGLVETGWIIPDATSTWAAKQYSKVPGYIFSNAGGTGGGLYVTKIKAPTY